MKNDEARFLLTAYRPDGRDAADPMFAEPLAQAAHDPELRGWLERQQKFDATCAGKLNEIAPPAGLREAILAGARASQPRRSWWTQPAWLAAAAAIAILAALAVRLEPSATLPAASEFATLALRDLAEAHDQHEGFPAGLANVQAHLASVRLPLPQHLALDPAELRQQRCRAVRIAGREVFEVCFNRDGVWYHLYVARRADFTPGTLDPKALLTTLGHSTGTAWADATRLYALVTDAGTEALRRVL